MELTSSRVLIADLMLAVMNIRVSCFFVSRTFYNSGMVDVTFVELQTLLQVPLSEFTFERAQP